MAEEKALTVEEQKNGPVAVAERRPAGLFEQIEREFDEARRRMAEMFRRPFTVPYGRPLLTDTTWAPTADMYEADGTLVVKAELPGVQKDDIAISIDRGLLTLTGKRTEAKEVKEAKYYAAERFSGAFTRSFALPEGIDPQTITAEHKDGVLEVRIPLPAKARAEAVKIPVTG
jgi:HSP20 family protein